MKHCYAGMLSNRFRLTYYQYDITYRVLVRKREGNGPRGIPRHLWNDNIKISKEDSFSS